MDQSGNHHSGLSSSSPFGALLVRYRAAAHLTQEQLAARAGLSVDAIAALERGKRRTPRAATVELLTEALALSDAERLALLAAARASGADPLASGASLHVVDATDVLLTRTSKTGWRRAAQPTPLVGRTSELDAIHRQLAVDGTRLLTLTGPPGVGKTRLAQTAAAQLADEMPDRVPDGVVWVDLAPTRDPQDVFDTIARGVGLIDTGHSPLCDRLAAYLSERALLLVLDNFEHVLPAATMLATLLGACPQLVLLVTSRVPLQLRGEQTLRIAPLAVPNLAAPLPPVDELLAIPAVQLFVTRARAHLADFTLTEARAPLVAQLVTQLDGLPLAIKLAAARMDVLPLASLVRRVEDRLQLLQWEAQDLPERQRSLEATLGWSYELLTEHEQRLFRHLGVFVGHVSLDAIAAVVEGNAEEGDTLVRLLSLAEKSLVLPIEQTSEDDVTSEDPEPAFGMLETVREYAWEHLAAAGELKAARRAHAQYFLALAEHADQQLRGRDQRAWYLRLEREQDNLRAALRWLLNHDDLDGPDMAAERAAGLRLTGALGYFWLVRGYHAEGRRWLEQALACAPQGEAGGVRADLAARTRALVAAGALLEVQGEVAQARAVLGEALALAERRRDPGASAWALTYLGRTEVVAREMEEAIRLLHEAQRRWEALGDPEGLGQTLFYLGIAADAAGDVAVAAARYAAVLEQLDAACDAQFVGFVRCYLAVAEWKRGDLPRAVEQVQAAVRTGVALRDRWLLCLAAQAAAALMGTRTDPARRVRLLGATDALARATGAALVWERLPAWRDMAELRARLEGEGGELAAAYREGCALPIGDVAALTLRLLEEVAQPLPHQEAVPVRLQQPKQQPAQHAERSPLSAREVEVLLLVAQGRSSKAIGRQLFLSPSTVNQHIRSIFNKLGADTRAQAVAVAAQRGLL